MDMGLRQLQGCPRVLVQISDPHLFADDDSELLGIPTTHTLELILEQVARGQPQVELLIATGDISQDGSPRSYERFCDLCTRYIPAPMYWLPGNHDELQRMGGVDGGHRYQSLIDRGIWQIVILDSSSIANNSHGCLGKRQLQLLQESLESHSDKFTLVAMHHPPFAVGSDWLDCMGSQDAQEFFRVFDRYPRVRAVLCGHVHQEVIGRHGDTRLLTCPATSIQFSPGSRNFQLDSQMPGYRWLHLYDDGTLKTGVMRLTGFPLQPDFAARGY